ncbi:MAG TPA: hypothetical protein VMI92_13005 [Steroidobacteraceae bacterium]|nr:hypothetical protein [Steroidobacteraceae bacterium]
MRLRTVLRTATGVVRPALLCVLLLLLAGGAVLIVRLVASPIAAARALVVLAAASNFLLCMAIAPSCLLVQRSAWQSRVPGLRYATAWVLAAVVLLTVILPTAWVALSGAPGVLWSLAALACSLAVGLGWLMLPITAAILLPTLLGWILREIAALAPVLDLGPAAAPTSTYELLVVATGLGALVAVRWRRLVRKPQLSLTFNAALLEKMVAMPDLMQVAATNPNAATAQMPAWLLPRMSRRLSATPLARLRTVLGPPFAPGYQRRMAVYFIALSGLLGLFTLLQLNPTRAAILPALVRVATQMLFGLIGGTAIAFTQRVALIFRPQSGELTELALLPSLATAKPPWRALLQAMLGPIAQTTAVLLAVAALLLACGASPGGIRLAMVWCAVVGLLQGAACMRQLSVGRRVIDNAGLATVLWVLLMALVLGALAGLGALWNLSAAPGRTGVVLVTLAALVPLALALRRWYLHAALLRQPFMIAADRSHASVLPAKETA